MTIRSDLVAEVLRQMRQGVRMWRALSDVQKATEIFGIYWKALSPDAQILIIKEIEEQFAQGAKTK